MTKHQRWDAHESGLATSSNTRLSDFIHELAESGFGEHTVPTCRDAGRFLRINFQMKKNGARQMVQAQARILGLAQ